MSEISLEFVLGAMPAAEATLYRVLIQLLPAPIAEMPNLGGRQIEMAELAELTGYSERWVIELMQRLEKKNFIRTDGGSGAVKWIWLLSPGAPRLGRPFPPGLTQKAAPGPGKAKAPRAVASIPKRGRKETTPSPKPGTDVKVAPPVEKPAEIPTRRRKGPIPPGDPAPGNLAIPATTVIPPPPPAPAGPTLPAAMVPPPSSTPSGGPAARNSKVRATKIAPLPSRAPGGPAAGKPMVPAAMETPPPSVVPAAPAKPMPPPPPRPDAPIEDLVAYVYALPVTSDLIWSLKAAVGNEHRLRIALEILCQQRRRYAQESNLKSAIRSALNDYL